MEQPKRYAIVCYLEGEAHDKVRVIQERLFELTGSRKCLDAWTPHLTLGSGILVSTDQQKAADDAFESLANSVESFDAQIGGFDGITNWGGAKEGLLSPFVLWINVEVNKNLQSLFDTIAKTITDHYETYYPRMTSYLPHVTVAFGDLSREGYTQGRKYLESINFQDVVKISHIALVENFTDKDVEYKRFYFKN